LNSYEMKQERRRERLEAAADSAEREGNARVERGRQMFDAIPLGQPLLVDHYSYKRDRNYRDRAWNNMGKGFESLDRAKELRARAAAVGSGGISSDDPDAVAKLREELAAVEARQVNMKAANKIVRAFYKAGVRDSASGELWERYVAKMTEAGLGDPESLASIKPDFAGRIGFPDYALQNNGANIRRIKGRIEQLEQRERARAVIAAEVEAAAEAGAPPPNELVIGEVRIVQNLEANRLQVFFPGKPSYDVRAKLKSYGFRWAPSEGAWQRHLSNAATHYAKEIAAALAGSAS
jgi:hypothetical protein